jgi:hypothetical protein
MNIFLKAYSNNFQVENRIADYLSRAMISNVSPAVNPEKCSVFGLKLYIIKKKVILRAALPKCVNMRMLDKDKCSVFRIFRWENVCT